MAKDGAEALRQAPARSAGSHDDRLADARHGRDRAVGARCGPCTGISRSSSAPPTVTSGGNSDLGAAMPMSPSPPILGA
ncbi:MAG: hypothetical protein MZV64_16890 [Ignavibacteriales bacterium]|nr:hypothetical protein [Ignavibacteriales bacterium]